MIVEDSRELAPNHPHVVRIEGRPANTELTGAISLTDLVRQSRAVQFRPDGGSVLGPGGRQLERMLDVDHDHDESWLRCALVSLAFPLALTVLARIASPNEPGLAEVQIFGAIGCAICFFIAYFDLIFLDGDN